MLVISVVKNYIFRDMMNTGILLMVIYIFFRKETGKSVWKSINLSIFLPKTITPYIQDSRVENTLSGFNAPRPRTVSLINGYI